MKTLLSIDDEPAMLEVLSDLLSKSGYRVLTSTNAEDGLRIFRENTIDLVLLDIHLPRRGGFSIYREIMSHRHVPVLFVTGFPKSFTATSSEVDSLWKNEFMEGITDILYKPFSIDLLFEKVESLIGNSEEVESGRAR